MSLTLFSCAWRGERGKLMVVENIAQVKVKHQTDWYIVVASYLLSCTWGNLPYNQVAL